MRPGPAQQLRALAVELERIVDLLLAENVELLRRNAMLSAQLDDAVDGLSELKHRNSELETVNEELRQLKETKSSKRGR